MKRKYLCLFMLIVFFLLFPSERYAFGLTMNYQYDDLYRLTRVERSDGWVTEYQYDALGNRLSRTIKTIMTGDVNGDSAVTLADAIVILQIISGISFGQPIPQNAEVNSDGRIGLPEAIYILQKTAGFR